MQNMHGNILNWDEALTVGKDQSFFSFIVTAGLATCSVVVKCDTSFFMSRSAINLKCRFLTQAKEIGCAVQYIYHALKYTN